MSDDYSNYNKLEKKMDLIVEKIHNIDLSLQRNTDSLEYHVRRTDLLEQHVKSLDNDIKPVKNHVERLNGIGRLIKYTSIIVGILGTLAAITFGFISTFN